MHTLSPPLVWRTISCRFSLASGRRAQLYGGTRCFARHPRRNTPSFLHIYPHTAYTEAGNRSRLTQVNVRLKLKEEAGVVQPRLLNFYVQLRILFNGGINSLQNGALFRNAGFVFLWMQPLRGALLSTYPVWPKYRTGATPLTSDVYIVSTLLIRNICQERTVTNCGDMWIQHFWNFLSNWADNWYLISKHNKCAFLCSFIAMGVNASLYCDCERM